MQQPHTARRALGPEAEQARRRSRRRAKRLRLLRNWVIFIAVCAVIVALMTSAILWLLPKVNALISRPAPFEAASYDGTGYVFNAADERLVLVNANLPYEAEPEPELAEAGAGVMLEAEAAAAYAEMAAAALGDGVELTLAAGYKDAETRAADYEAQKQLCIANGDTEEQATVHAAAVVPRAECAEHGTGYAADILSAGYTALDTGFASTRAYEWLEAYAAEYGFILRYPEARQAATGVTFEPWHWRYVGRENALAMRASGLSLEEFIALNIAQ